MALLGIHNPFCVPDLSTSKPTTMQSIRLHIKSLKRRGAYGRLEVLYNPIRKFWHFINFRIKEQADLENRIKYVCKHLGVRRRQVIPVEHHRANGYYALYASPFRKDTLVLTHDGEGDGLSATVNLYTRRRLKRIGAVKTPVSIGLLYTYTTLLLGMKPLEHEFKVMGLVLYAPGFDVKEVYNIYNRLIDVSMIGVIRKISLGYLVIFNFLHENLEGYRLDVIVGDLWKFVKDMFGLRYRVIGEFLIVKS